MDSRTLLKSLPVALVALTAAALLVAGCSGGGTGTMPTGPTQPAATGPAFVVGTDAPMASVVSFAVQIDSIDATDASGNTVSLLSGMPTVDFARFNGLQTLLDMNDVNAGTYSKISITLGSATIGYLNMPASGAPAIATEAAISARSFRCGF